MWEGWSKPAELASSRAPPSGERVSQAMGGRASSLGDRGVQGRPEPERGQLHRAGLGQRPQTPARLAELLRGRRATGCGSARQAQPQDGQSACAQ